MATFHAEPRNGKKALHPEDLEEFETILKRRKATLADDILGLNRDWLDKSEGDAAHSNHMAESGTDAFEEDVRLSRMESAGEEIEEIEAALGRIRQGTFGVCEECAKPLPTPRLRAIPYARLCLSCKEAEEAS
jgi:RNA polymerase-binding transcription factor DksA